MDCKTVKLWVIDQFRDKTKIIRTVYIRQCRVSNNSCKENLERL